jgi:hypothetical protein
MTTESDDFFRALEILNGLTETCKVLQCGKSISREESDNNWGTCLECFDREYDAYYESEAAKQAYEQAKWEEEEFERLRANGQV